MRFFFRICGIKRLIGVPLTEDMQENRWMEAEQALEPEGARAGQEFVGIGGCAAGSGGELGICI